MEKSKEEGRLYEEQIKKDTEEQCRDIAKTAEEKEKGAIDLILKKIIS